jgi:ATP-binding cassette subfamily B protein
MARATSDLASIRMLTGPGLMTTANAIFAPALIIPLMCSINWRLTLLSLIPMPLLLVTTQVFSRRVHERSKEVQEHYGSLTSAAQEVLTGMRLLRAYSQERNAAARFKEASRELVRRNLALIRLSVIFVPLLQFFFALGHIGILWYGSYLILSGRLSIGQFVQVTLYLGLIWAPMISLGGVINQYQRARASMKRIDNIMSIQPAISDSGATLAVKDISGGIEFNNLSFTYQGANAPALKDISLRIAPGQTVAFVGSTGSGKTTLMNLVTRLLDAEPGQLLIDGRPIREIPLRVLRAGIGYVPQESSLFSETIAENISYGVEPDSFAEIELAATMADLAEDIKEFPEGFETLVGERGVKLSGGQRQRTAIARALIKRSSILILDDALSAVDTQTEERILENLRVASRGRTSLVVSHRVSTVRDADLIVVLDDGRIVEQGTQRELVTRGGLYASMIARQQLDEELAAC